MRTGRFRWAAAALAAALLVLAAACSEGEGEADFAGVSSTISTRSEDRSARGLAAVRGFRSARRYRETPPPVRLEIRRIGVATDLQRLGPSPDRNVEEPTDWDVAGWYVKSPRPGDPGSAVVLGHVDSKAGPAVFYRLRELRPGDRIDVIRADRSRITFTVDRVAQYPKRRFPTDEVFYPTLSPRLQLVTCGGAFDQESGHYLDNVIAFASLSG